MFHKNVHKNAIKCTEFQKMDDKMLKRCFVGVSRGVLLNNYFHLMNNDIKITICQSNFPTSGKCRNLTKPTNVAAIFESLIVQK